MIVSKRWSARYITWAFLNIPYDIYNLYVIVLFTDLFGTIESKSIDFWLHVHLMSPCYFYLNRILFWDLFNKEIWKSAQVCVCEAHENTHVVRWVTHICFL